MRKRVFAWVLALLLLPTFALAGEAPVGESAAPKYIFYMIGDGMGMSHRQLAQFYTQYKTGDNTRLLAMNDMPVTANITTWNENTLVTDSASAGTALATGRKTKTGVIGMNAEGTESYRSITEALREKGMSIGLITTVTVTHATPASFGAHVADRNDESGIAEQYLNAGWDFIAGGGLNFFADANEGGAREEGDSLLDDFEAAGYTIDTDLASFGDTDFAATNKYLGVYEPKYLTEVITQKNGTKVSPTLSEMTQAGIDALVQDEDGFFMMVEGGYIDGAAHNNDAPTTLHETLAFEEAVQTAVQFYNAHPDETLIIVAADHETGGLSLGFNSYSMDMEALDSIKVAYERAIDKFLKEGDIDGYFAAMEEHYGLTISQEEREDVLWQLENYDLSGMMADFGITDPAEIAEMEGMRHMFGISGHVSAHLLAKRTKVAWSTQAHTGEPVPLTALGIGSERFGLCKDNTDVPKTLAELCAVSLDIQ